MCLKFIQDKNKAENKPPYFDLSSLGSPQFRVVLFAAAMGTLGAYAPLFYLVSPSLGCVECSDATNDSESDFWTTFTQFI